MKKKIVCQGLLNQINTYANKIFDWNFRQQYDKLVQSNSWKRLCTLFSHYGNTGCEVNKRGIQNLKGSTVLSQMKLLNLRIRELEQ